MISKKNITNQWPVLGIVFLLLFLIQSNGYGENTIEPLYTLNKALMPKLEPKIYPTKKVEIVGIFDFPVDNAIATNMLPGTNAVTLISFDEKKTKSKI